MKKFLYGYYVGSSFLAFYEEYGETKKMEFATEQDANEYFNQKR